MAYQAIYRKWRPLSFSDVVGQSHITETLKTEVATGKIAHAYLFCGTRGTGKTSTAKILSRAINCEAPLPNGDPCNQCAACKGILSGSVMDVVEIDAASNNGVDSIRELRDEVLYTPASVKYKVYIIDEVHMLSTAAFNALLKTLEEPPAHVIFILATTEPHKILPTIQSRCQRFDFRRILTRDIAGRIGEIVRKDGLQISEDAIRLVAELGDGSMRDALSILDLCSGIDREVTVADIESLTGVADNRAVRQTAAALIAGDTSAALTQINSVLSLGRDVGNLLDELVKTFRDLLICKMSKSPEAILDKAESELSALKTLAGQTTAEYLLYAIKVLSDTVSVCKWATMPSVMLESAAVKLANPAMDASNEAFAARISALEMGAVRPAPAVNAAPTVPAVKEEVPLPEDDAPPFAVDEPAAVDEIPVPEAEPEMLHESVPIPEPVPEPVPEPELTVEPVAEPIPEPVPEPTPEPVLQPSQGSWQEVLEQIRTVNPMLYGLICDVEGRTDGEGVTLLFEDKTLLDMIAQNENHDAFLRKASGGKVQYKLKNEQQTDNGDPLDEILAKQVEFEGQMTIL